MSGDRQHFIPRFLQAGFTSRAKGNEKYTWVFRRDTPPFETNISNVGLGYKFYTQNEDTEVDDLITTIESKFGSLINNLRNGIKSSLSNPALPDMIAHFEVRTRHLRENFRQVSEFIFSDIMDFVADEDLFANYLKEKIRDDPEILREAFEEELRNQHLPKEQFELLVELAQHLAPRLIDQQKSEFPSQAAALRAMMSNKLSEAIKSGHIKALKPSITPNLRIERYRKLHFNIISNPEKEPLILGDSIVLFHIDGIKSYKTFLEANDRLIAVYLPIDSNTILVGSQQLITHFPTNLRKEIACCSLEHFVASENTESNQTLQKTIGNNSELLSRSEVESIVKNIFEE